MKKVVIYDNLSLEHMHQCENTKTKREVISLTCTKKFIIPIITWLIGINLVTIGSYLLNNTPLIIIFGRLLCLNGTCIAIVSLIYSIYIFIFDRKESMKGETE